MGSSTVLGQIVEWSESRPTWQRDALRRLMLNGELSSDDISELLEVCKSAHGLAESQKLAPLTSEQLPEITSNADPISLVSICHHRGVNALAENQTLKFAQGLTVVYGDNGAGKTGYIRILKNACRARGQEQILGNVVSGSAPLIPMVTIKYKIGTTPEVREWNGSDGDQFVSRVSVFDTQCAAVYLNEKTDVAFRPFGLDLFDKLVKACKTIRSLLEVERSGIASHTLGGLQAQVPENTVAANFLKSISSLTNTDAFETLSRISPEEEARFSLLEKSRVDLRANDPEKLIQQLNLRAGRVRTLAQHIKAVESVLSAESIDTVFEVRKEGRRKREEARRLREVTFPTGLLDGTGTDLWLALWEDARHFSKELAYPDRTYPVTESDAHCVLCQQKLDLATSQRLEQFEAFVASTTERELQQIRAQFARLRKSFVDLKTTSELVDDVIREISIENEAVANAVIAMLANSEKRRLAVATALTEDKDISPDFPTLVLASQHTQALEQEIEGRILALRNINSDEQRRRVTTDAQELRARKFLSRHRQPILAEIERQKKYAAYGLCIEETRTQAITQKSTAVTRTAVSQQLKRSFKQELHLLSFGHVEVELKEIGGSDGVFYHKLVLSRAPGVELPKVVSEGEQRCLSIAAFFAELSTADDPSGIVFDDPVSSLDYQWRQGVAQRLVLEAKSRQVIVFTHDVVFLLLLKQIADECGVDQIDQHVRNLSKGAGVCAEELPWVAMPVKKKIGYLKNLLQAAEKKFREGEQDAYERDAKYLYGLLREAWERALEEVLLGGIVERYRPSIQTQQVAQIADITSEDCKTVETAMTKCSKWLTGHDQAAAARAPIPGATELKADIDSLESWVSAIRKRRN